MPSFSRTQREVQARTRLLRILSSHGIANWRTLEQKISDAGPSPQRIDPHILTPVRRQLEKEGLISRRNESGTPWYYLSEAPKPLIEERLSLQLPVWQAIQADNLKKRVGQSLELAIYRALLFQDALPDYLGAFLDLNDHDDSTLYSKEEPPRRLGKRTMDGRLDFLVRHPDAGWAGIEAKNIREWMYPDRDEIFQLLSKCFQLNAVPVLIARRIHFSTFAVLNACGVVIHQTFNQFFPESETKLADQARHKHNLGYHDIRPRNTPDARLSRFVSTDLPKVLPEHRARFETHQDIIGAYVASEMSYREFAARVRRRRLGQNEDHDWEDSDDRPEY